MSAFSHLQAQYPGKTGIQLRRLAAADQVATILNEIRAADYITKAQAEFYFEIGSDTLRQWRDDGVISAVKVGLNQWRYKRELKHERDESTPRAA